MSDIPIHIALPEPHDEQALQQFYKFRLLNMQVPYWRDDPSYFWVDECKRKREEG